MGYGLRVPVQVYRIPEGCKFLIVEHDEGKDASQLVKELGVRAIHVAIDHEGHAFVFTDNAPDGEHSHA